jgi:hypothetical protein
VIGVQTHKAVRSKSRPIYTVTSMKFSRIENRCEKRHQDTAKRRRLPRRSGTQHKIKKIKTSTRKAKHRLQIFVIYIQYNIAMIQIPESQLSVSTAFQSNSAHYSLPPSLPRLSYTLVGIVPIWIWCDDKSRIRIYRTRSKSRIESLYLVQFIRKYMA